jgi:hypothetical protein
MSYFCPFIWCVFCWFVCVCVDALTSEGPQDARASCVCVCVCVFCAEVLTFTGSDVMVVALILLVTGLLTSQVSLVGGGSSRSTQHTTHNLHNSVCLWKQLSPLCGRGGNRAQPSAPTNARPHSNDGNLARPRTRSSTTTTTPSKTPFFHLPLLSAGNEDTKLQPPSCNNASTTTTTTTTITTTTTHPITHRFGTAPVPSHVSLSP